ncbi:hypothetical protein CDV36_012709 [Fusarium kuroshium]|uniref:Uncharacterized protein n=1 Tax=Fusarium kuroshium TaxID=2010991 RepID=A0A3M2RR59_9HYPO|nr:hypothetical protein CDV36_012709 [Fusarium kuroshium]
MPPRSLLPKLHAAEAPDPSLRTRRTPVGIIDCALTDPRGPPSTEKILTLNVINSSVSHAQTPDDASSHFRHLLDAYNDDERHTILRGITNESPTLARLGRDASQLRSREEIDREKRRKADKKKQADAVWLDAEWGGNGWIPVDVRAGLSTVGLDEPSGEVVRFMRKITEAAKNQCVLLPSLWEPGGALRVAVDREVARKTENIRNRQSPPEPHLTGRIAKQVYQSIINPVTEEEDQLSEIPHGSPPPVSPYTNGWTTHSVDENPQQFDPASSPPPSSLRSDTQFYTPPPYPLDDTMARPSSGGNATSKRHLSVGDDETPASDHEKRQRLMHLGENLQAIGLEEMIRASLGARSRLDTALASKSRADLAVASLKGRITAMHEAQQATHNHIKDEEQKLITLLSRNSHRDSGIGIETQSSNNGLRSALESGASLFLDGAKSSRDLIIALGQGLEQEMDEACRRQQEAVDGVCEAQETLDMLDRLCKAKENHEGQAKAKRHLDKMEALAKEAREQFEEANRQYIKSLEMAEGKKWMECVDALRKLHTQERLEE